MVEPSGSVGSPGSRLLVQNSLESLCCVIQQDTLSAA